jgi:hypothetical protein
VERLSEEGKPDDRIKCKVGTVLNVYRTIRGGPRQEDQGEEGCEGGQWQGGRQREGHEKQDNQGDQSREERSCGREADGRKEKDSGCY